MKRAAVRAAPLVCALAALAAVALACSSSGTSPASQAASEADSGAGDGGAPAASVPPKVYLAKVKNVLVGLPPTDDELRAVEADPAALGALVDRWMQLPEYARKMMRFFELSFQQTQVTSNDFADQVHAQLGWNPGTTPLLLQNAEESFARTMLELTARGRPFTEAMTTTQLMMTTALKELYAFLDTVEIDDDSNTFDHFRAENRTVQIVAEASEGPIPIAETLDPSSPHYMHWYDPDVATAEGDVPGCRQDPVLLPTQAITLHYLLYGTLDGRRLQNGALCPLFPGTANAAQLARGDFDDWTLVTLRAPRAGEAISTFYDLRSLRTARELVLRMPRAGFFSTPAFFANWPTNVSNQMRVTTHQALIVATGSSVDGTDTTSPNGAPGMDAAHAKDVACAGCHAILDPTRSILASTWSWNYHNQQDPLWTAQPGVFAFRGSIRPVASVADFGRALAEHPLVASGWTQRLCAYVNSAPCDEQDPEVQRIVSLFRDSGYSWSALVKALVTSNVTTGAIDSRGETVAVARRDHLCAQLDARLGLTNACGLDALGGGEAPEAVAQIVSGLPSDAYGRGTIAPILPNEPTLFFRAGTENLCESLAARMIDAPATPRATPRAKGWSSAQPDAAIAMFVSDVMGLPPSDSRAAPALQILKAHYVSALEQSGISPSDALRSTFVVACSAPSAISIGL